jgi:hypothetical protein
MMMAIVLYSLTRIPPGLGFLKWVVMLCVMLGVFTVWVL